LEAEGYEVQPVVLAAAGVGAPHRRDRVWFVAHAKHDGRPKHSGGLGCEMRKKENGGDKFTIRTYNDGEKRITTDTNGNRLQGGVLSGSYGQQGGDRSIGFITEHLHTHGRETIQRGGWENFPTQSPICGRDDGIPDGLDGITFPKWRNESIKAYGNAVCPQVVHQIFKAIEQYEQLNTQLKTST
jgi:DNA (cytosine-5)-methyltransferase 1